MGLNDLKRRWSFNTSRKQAEIFTDAEAPSPTIPMDSKRGLARSDKQRLEVPSSLATPNFSKHVDRAPTPTRKASGRLPVSLSFEDEEASARGEPLFHHDFPSRSIPKEFKPYPRARAPGAMEGRPSSENRSINTEFGEDKQDCSDERRSRAQSPVRIVPSRDRLVPVEPSRRHILTREQQYSYFI
jgi:hypothetical protein